MSIKKIVSVLLAAVMLFALAACSDNSDGDESNAESTAADIQGESSAEPAADIETTTAHETTTEPETTTQETTTKAPDGEAIKDIVNTLESKVFYMAGTMKLTSGESMEAKFTSDGDNMRVEIVSSQMKLTIIYLDGTAYLINNSTNYYAVLDEVAFDSVDQLLSMMSSYGVSFSNQDISEMKSMITDFDDAFDYSQYIEGGTYDEFTAKVDGEEYLCSRYATDYGKIYLYTQDGSLKIVDVYDSDGLKQMNFIITAFIPQVLTPITLTGYTKTTSILNLFTGVS